jgi:hypothetical protein
MRFAFGLLALMVLLIPTRTLLGQSVRLAVIGDPTLGNLSDTVTVELSKDVTLTVLDRADLNKLSQEAALQTVVNSNDFTALQPLPADGLIVLRALQIDGKTNVLARLIAVQPGVVLREIALPPGKDVLAQAQAIAPAFAPYWPKLAAVAKGNANALSLLGLRFEVDAPETHEMERQFNVLLASRLGAEPDTIVLERWRLNDAVFEKSLVAKPSSFWTGSSLIDGSMKWDKATNRVTVSLRMRPAQGAVVSLNDADTADHLVDLVGRLADKIQAHRTDLSGPWQPAAEAAHYAELGKWCLDNRLFEEGAQAIETALALGDNSVSTNVLQIRAYTSLAYPDEAPDAFEFYDPNGKPPDAESVPDRVKSGTTAVELVSRYLSANSKPSVQVAASEDPVTLSLNVVNNCLRLLRYAYQKGFAGTDKDDVATLRHDLQKLLATLDAARASMPSFAGDRLLKYEVRYVPFWHETPEETIAYYRDLLNRSTDGVAIRDELITNFYLHLHPIYLPPEAQLKLLNPTNDPRMLNLGDWYVGSPRVIAWDDRPADDVVAKWNDFLRDLNASPDPVLQSDAIKFQSCPVYNLNEPNPLLGTLLVEFLEKNQQSISGHRGNDLVAGLSLAFTMDVAPDKTNLDRLRTLGEALLQQKAVLPSEWILLLPHIYHEAPPDLAARVVASLDDYGKWYQTQVPQDPSMVEALVHARKSLSELAGVPDNSPGGVGPGSVTPGGGDSIVVNRRWPQNLSEPFPQRMHSNAYTPSMIIAENKVWTLMMGGKMVQCIDPSTLQSVNTFPLSVKGTETPDPTRPTSAFLGVTPQFLVATAAGQVMLCSRSDQSCRTLDVPPSNYKPCWVNQQLYLIYDAGAQLKRIQEESESADSASSGLIRVSLPDGAIENLVSTRRIPPQSPLDGKPLGFPLNLWSSSTGLMLAVMGKSPAFQVFGTPAGKNDWAPVTSDSILCDVKTGDGGMLVGKGIDGHGFAQLVLMNGTDSQVLLSNPARMPSGDNSSPRWDLPDDLRTMSPQVQCRCSAVMRGNDLCLYSVTRGDTGTTFDACLYYFAHGQKSGTKIPLKFAFAELAGATTPQEKMMAAVQSVIQDFQSLQATNYGLVIVQEFSVGGFCVIPWGDVDACLGTHKISVSPPTASTPVAVSAPVESSATPAPGPVPPPIASTPAVVPTPAPLPQTTALPAASIVPKPQPAVPHYPIISPPPDDPPSQPKTSPSRPQVD